MLLRSTLISYNLNWSISKWREYRFRIDRPLTLLLHILMLLTNDLSTMPIINCPIVLFSAYCLLWATVPYHQWIIISEELMVIYSTIGHSHVGSMVTSINVLMLVCYCRRRSVYHMVLGLLNMGRSFLAMIVVLGWTRSSIPLVWSLHHVFGATVGLVSTVGKALGWVLVLSLWMIIMMTSATSCGHRLIDSTATIRYMTWMYMLWCWARSIRTTGYSAWIDVVRTMHLLLAPRPTIMVSWSGMHRWRWCFSVTPWRLSMSRAMDRLIVLLSRKFTCFGIPIIIESHIGIILVTKSRGVAVSLSVDALIIIFWD